MGVLKPAIILYTSGFVFLQAASLKILLQAGLSLRSPNANEEESPDSKGQCTGEEPGVPALAGATDSATENNCPPAGG